MQATGVKEIGPICWYLRDPGRGYLADVWGWHCCQGFETLKASLGPKTPKIPILRTGHSPPTSPLIRNKF